MSKASDLKPRRKPPKVVTLPVSCFVETWSARPQTPLAVGLRRASAGETEMARLTAVELVDKLLPTLKNRHHDSAWKEAYDIALLHIMVSYTLTRPDDIDQPLWPRLQADGDKWVAADTSEALTALRNPSQRMVSRLFTVDGMGRVYDEMHVLALENNPLWPELDDEGIGNFFQRLPHRLKMLKAPAALGERDDAVDKRQSTAKEIRRLLGYLDELAYSGIERPADPVATQKPAGQGAAAQGASARA